MRIRLLVIAGPTATGKTRLGVRVAHAMGSEIVSADSRQVYRGLDLGSGKDLGEYRAVSPPVPVHLIDVADPMRPYSVFRHQRDCYALLAAKAREPAYREGRPLVMVGGTGLWIEAVLRGYRIPDVPEDEALRRQLMARPLEDLDRELRDLDPDLHGRTDRSTRKRVVRAIEIARHARVQEVTHSPPPPVTIEASVFVVEMPNDELYRRIDLRLRERLELGMIDEVRGLLDAGIPVERMDQLGLEYREITAYLTGAKSRERMVEDLAAGIRAFARRQRTWFRGFPRRGLACTPIGPGDAAAILDRAGRR